MSTESPLPRMKVVFYVTGMIFNPNQCTEVFGIAPTSVEIKGETRITKNDKKYLITESFWCRKTDWKRFDNTDLIFQELLPTLWARREQIKSFLAEQQLSTDFRLNLCGVGERNFLFELSTETISKICYFGAKISFDLI